MTDYELHRQEFIAERSGMILDDHPGMSVEEADVCAKDIWDAMEELAWSARGPANDLD